MDVTERDIVERLRATGAFEKKMDYGHLRPGPRTDRAELCTEAADLITRLDLPVSHFDLHGLEEWELDRLTAAEIACDETITILERHGFDANTHPLLLGLRMSSRLSHDILTRHEGAEMRRLRLLAVRQKLNRAFPGGAG